MLDYVDLSEPLVSVVIPCWNVEKYVTSAIDSVLKQTYRNIEVIAVDDGSTDGTLDVLKSYEGKIRILTGPNRGLSAARNVGIFAANGELVQFLDADDVLYERKISSGVRNVQKCTYQKTIVVAPGEMELINGEVIDRPCEHIAMGDPMVSLLLGEPIQSAAFLYWKRDLIAVGGFNDGYCEDFDLYARFCALGYKFQNIHEVGFRIYQIEGSMSSIGYGYLSYRPVAYRRALNLALKHGNWTPARAEALSYKLLRDAVLLLRFVEDRATALSNIRESKAISKAGRKKFFGEQPMWTKTAIALLGYQLALQAVDFARKHLRRKPTQSASKLTHA